MCNDCRENRLRIAELERRLDELEFRLRMDKIESMQKGTEKRLGDISRLLD